MSCLAQYSALDKPLEISSWHKPRQNDSRSILLMNFGTRRLRIADSNCVQRESACNNFNSLSSCSLIDAYVELSSKNIKVQGADHYQKAQDAIVGIEKILGKEGLSAHDRMVAENVRLDLMDALGDKLWYSQTNIPKL